MRMLSALMTAVIASMLSACVSGPDAGSIEDFQFASAEAIGGGIAASDIKIQNRYVLLFTSHWTAIAPGNAVYLCTRDEINADAACKPSGR